MVIMAAMSVDWNRPVWVIFMICTTVVICVCLTQVHKWIWRK